MNFSEADRAKLRRALAAKPSLNGNLLTFIGLDEVRAKFPAEWERNRSRMLETARSIIQQFSDPSTDMVLPRGDGFVVLFTRLVKDESLLRAAMIKAEILRRFTGDEALDALDVVVEAIELDSGAILNGALGDLLSKAAPATGAGAKAAGASSGTDRRQKARRASLEELAVHGAEPLEQLERRFGYDFDELDYAFQPHLYVPRGVFSVFACKPVRYGATGDILAGYAVLPREVDAAQVAALDTMTLLRARHGLVDMAVRKRVAIVVAPVSFDTMSSRSASSEYLELLAKIPPDLRNYMVVALSRCPAGVPEGRLAEILNPLKRLARAVCVRIEASQQSLVTIRAAGGYSVGFNLTQAAGTEMAAPGFLPRFVASARKLGLQCFVDGVDTAEQLQRCRKAAPDYIAGRALAEMSDYVGPITELRAA